MRRSTILPTSSFHIRPAFWGLNRDFKEVVDSMENLWEGRSESFSDFKETDKAYFLSLDVPGLGKKSLEINVEGDNVFITGHRKNPFSEDDNEATKKISRTVKVPELVDKEKIQAHVEDGVLYLALPKLEKETPKKIEITDSIENSNWNNLLGKTTEK